ncbi:alpha/beta hydrolase [Halomarina oriensis]|uniref:Alpha/beta hydrolase n=1 Tax=Halomarina oriensis TaxID=671145 RepID=A0A6B0GMC6_9EURY|nr:dienelactone hydrolase family protein [Halomarina oriensis]MWG35071.1 alpha/beta hydrolase [Halomarina oriensis]
MTDAIVVPHARDVRATLDGADAETCVVACPPHPQMGGSRSDARLTALGETLAPDVDCLRFDYGAWDGGRGERTDVHAALDWADERYDRVGLFGFSFGGCLALVVGSEREALACVSSLAPAARISEDVDAVAALDAIDAPTQVVYGERDSTAEWEPVVERARALGLDVEGFSGDHFFIGQEAKVAGRCAEFLADHL